MSREEKVKDEIAVLIPNLNLAKVEGSLLVEGEINLKI
jgi:hypothetical protein